MSKGETTMTEGVYDINTRKQVEDDDDLTYLINWPV